MSVQLHRRPLTGLSDNENMPFRRSFIRNRQIGHLRMPLSIYGDQTRSICCPLNRLYLPGWKLIIEGNRQLGRIIQRSVVGEEGRGLSKYAMGRVDLRISYDGSGMCKSGSPTERGLGTFWKMGFISCLRKNHLSEENFRCLMWPLLYEDSSRKSTKQQFWSSLASVSEIIEAEKSFLFNAIRSSKSSGLPTVAYPAFFHPLIPSLIQYTLRLVADSWRSHQAS